MTSSLDIAKTLGFTGALIDIPILGVSTKNDPLPNTIAFINKHNEADNRIITLNQDTIFISNKIPEESEIPNVIYSINPRSDYGKVAKIYFEPKVLMKFESTAIIPQDLLIGEECYIGHHVVIEENVKIGSGCKIGHGSVISKGTIIGDHSTIGNNTSIGGPGFGYDLDEDGNPFRIPHLGSVIIGDHVDIGANVSIARGTIGNTIIADYVKIDDCVFIAHNVSIGRGSFIIAGAEISGSVRVGERVWISPEVTIINKVSIGDDSLIGIGSTVTKNVDPGMVAVGSPAKAIKKRYK